MNRNAGLGNVRPAGRMQPTKHLNVAHEHFLGSLYIIYSNMLLCWVTNKQAEYKHKHKDSLINYVKLHLLKKMKSKKLISS